MSSKSVTTQLVTLQEFLNEKKRKIEQNAYSKSVPLARYYDCEKVAFLEPIIDILGNIQEQLETAAPSVEEPEPPLYPVTQSITRESLQRSSSIRKRKCLAKIADESRDGVCGYAGRGCTEYLWPMTEDTLQEELKKDPIWYKRHERVPVGELVEALKVLYEGCTVTVKENGILIDWS